MSSSPPLARTVPSGLNARPQTLSRCPVSGRPRGTGQKGEVRSHIRIVWSSPLLARVTPSGLKASARTVLVWPGTGLARGSIRPGTVTSHTLMARSVPLLTRSFPSGLNASALTGTPPEPIRRWTRGAGPSLADMSHNLTTPSASELAMVRPSGLKTTAWTAESWCLSPRPGRSGWVASQVHIVPAFPAAASVLPSGLNATWLTSSAEPVARMPFGPGLAGSVTSHSRTSPALPALATVVPARSIASA